MGKENECKHDAPPGAHIIHNDKCNEKNVALPVNQTTEQNPPPIRLPVGAGT